MQKSLGYDWGIFHCGDKHCFTLCFLYWKLEKTPGVIPKNMKDWSFLENFKIHFISVSIQWFFFSFIRMKLTTGWSFFAKMMIPQAHRYPNMLSLIVFLFLFLNLSISKDHFCTMDVNVYFWSFYEALYNVNISFLLNLDKKSRLRLSESGKTSPRRFEMRY